MCTWHWEKRRGQRLFGKFLYSHASPLVNRSWRGDSGRRATLAGATLSGSISLGEPIVFAGERQPGVFGPMMDWTDEGDLAF